MQARSPETHVSSRIELTRPVDLCRAHGTLAPDAVGWSRRPLHTCNLSGAWPRKKRWEYWCVTTPTHALTATLADIDYLGLASVELRDLHRAATTRERAGAAATTHWRREGAKHYGVSSADSPDLRRDGPVRSMRWALWMRRSRIASATVGSPIYSCQCLTGS